MKRQHFRVTNFLIAAAAALILSGCMAAVDPSTASPAAAGDAVTAESRPAAGSSASSADRSTYAFGSAASPSRARPAAEHDSAAASVERYAPEPPASASESLPSATESHAFGESGRRSGNHSAQFAPVTAGVVDDNEQWRDYLDYRERSQGLWVNDRDVRERHVIRVWDERAHPVHDATVEVFNGNRLIFSGKTDAGGRLLFHPLALETARNLQQARTLRLVATKGQVTTRQDVQRSDDQWAITLEGAPRAAQTRLDLMFLIDATGSMSDEIAKLKASIADVADQIARLPEQPEVRYGLVAYRDEGDEFVVRTYGFTDKLSEFQGALAPLSADGGGDTPEALNEALHRALNDAEWRDEESVRLMILVADAPPHLDYGWQDFSYETDMVAAVEMGVKLFPVGASGLEADGEYIFRQLAQFTGGKFVFLTYEDGGDPTSGPGTETTHDVENYSVDTLDRLIVRLVSDELAQLSDR